MISYADKIKIIQSARRLFLNNYPEDIDIAGKGREERLGIIIPEKPEEYLSMGFTRFKGDPIDYIVELLTTPRLLKLVLRHTRFAWDILHGEIDFDDLLMINTLKFAAPEAYNFLLVNIYEIRSLEFSDHSDRRDDRIKDLKMKWENSTAKVAWSREAAIELITVLFPYWDMGIPIRDVRVPQGVMHSKPADYWLRSTIVDLSHVIIRDQKVIRAVRSWKEDMKARVFEELDLPTTLYKHNEFDTKFEQLAPYLPLNGEEIRALASDVFEHILVEHGKIANEDSSPAFITLWRLATRRPIDEKKHTEWVINEIREALQLSLRFANAIYDYWRHNSGMTRRQEQPMPEIRNPFIDYAKEMFANNPDKLINILDPSYPYSIYHFAVLFSEKDRGGSGTFNPDDWTWLAEVLLDAALIDPKTIMPHLAFWIFIRHGMFGEYTYEYKHEWANSLFKGRLREVMELVVSDIDYDYLSVPEQATMAFAKQTAQKWLEEHK